MLISLDFWSGLRVLLTPGWRLADSAATIVRSKPKADDRLTVHAYALERSVVDDFRALEEQRRGVEEGRLAPNRTGLLDSTIELKQVLTLALESGEQAIKALDNFGRPGGSRRCAG